MISCRITAPDDCCPSAEQALVDMHKGLSSSAYLDRCAPLAAGHVDVGFTNWNHSNIEDMNFGTGPVAHPNGFFWVQRPLMVVIVGLGLHGDIGLRMVVPEQGLERLQDSPTLRDMAPSSGLMHVP